MKRQAFHVCSRGNGDEEEDEEEGACGGKVQDLGMKCEMMRLLRGSLSCSPLSNFNRLEIAKSILRLTVRRGLVATIHPPNQILYQVPVIQNLL